MEWLGSLTLVLLLWLCHHHLTELIKVHGSRTIFIKFLKNTLKFLFSERCEEFSNQSSECLCCDVAKALLVINPESILEFPLHGSISGSSTKNVAQSWLNSPNSISPEPSSSISA